MESKLIVMLTHKDLTVDNALEVFESCADLPIDYWGFKDVGISKVDARRLVEVMRYHNKTTFLEVVNYSEDECQESARMAVDAGFDYLTGTRFYPSVANIASKNNIGYFPFVGNVSGSPVKLEGSISDILEECKQLEEAGVSGLDLVAYRYADGNPVDLAKQVVTSAEKKVIIAGSIADEERLKSVAEINPYAFTMGGALFEKKFDPEGDFRSNLERVIELMGQM